MKIPDEQPNMARTKEIRIPMIEEPDDPDHNTGVLKEFTSHCDSYFSLPYDGDYSSCPVSLPWDGYYPSCRYCWNGYIFGTRKVYCEKCNISRCPTFLEEVTRNHIKGSASYCKNGHLIELNTEKRRFECCGELAPP